ncbi:Uncharacterized protein FKW44_020745 [Caligus rogercresseyi]|uniref:Resolvase HTH domain-containing protein n=1 Tax=Caligus rogercresseyi TaxID=217165 RepID=A0A7T8JVW8_CALRO|nr:Uncharacterized protein FKW44_020745 [Caligus rogercresseyi]
MSSERDRRLQVRALLDSGQTPTEIACQLGISRKTVYNVKAGGVERKVGSGGKRTLDEEEVIRAIEEDPLKSLRSHARDMGIPKSTLVDNVKKIGGRS